MSLSLCMCLKNEAEGLRETIDQVVHLVDEMVVGIDKTTTDSTREIIDFYRNKVGKLLIYEYEWQNDFSKMRNECLSKATRDWILMLDGHDYLLDGERMIGEIARDENERVKASAVVDALMQDPVSDDGTKCAYQRPIMFRNKWQLNGKVGKAGMNGVKFELPIHNIVNVPIEHRIITKDIVLEHRQSKNRRDDRKRQRQGMNIPGLRKRIEDDPDDVRSYFYLARTYDEMGECENAIEWFEKYIALSTFPEERYHAKFQAASNYIRLWQKSEGDESRDVHLEKAKELLLACWLDNVPRNEHCMLLGDIARARKFSMEAAHWYNLATSYDEPGVFIFVIRECYTWLPWEKAAIAYSECKRYEKALKAVRKAAEWRPEKKEYYLLIKQLKKEMANEGKV